MVISHLKEEVEARDSELQELTAWKEVQINKLDYTRKLLEESEASVEALKEILKDKEVEIMETKNQLRQAKEDAFGSITSSTPSERSLVALSLTVLMIVFVR